MTNEEAQFLLQGYRPDGSDAQDPQLADALEQMERDPALRTWFEEQQAFDKAVSEKLRSEPIPQGLKSDILAGGKTLQMPGWWRRHPALTALAACLAALIAVTAVLFEWESEEGFAAYRAEMVRFVSDVEEGREPLQLTSGELAGIRAWIAENSVHESVELPASLTEDSGIGCRVIEWEGASVTLACFHLPSGDVAHLVVIEKPGLIDRPSDGVHLMASLDGKNTAAWSVGARTYLLISGASAESLRGLL